MDEEEVDEVEYEGQEEDEEYQEAYEEAEDGEFTSTPNAKVRQS